jgi:hypothetical protein
VQRAKVAEREVDEALARLQAGEERLFE